MVSGVRRGLWAEVGVWGRVGVNPDLQVEGAVAGGVFLARGAFEGVVAAGGEVEAAFAQGHGPDAKIQPFGEVQYSMFNLGQDGKVADVREVDHGADTEVNCLLINAARRRVCLGSIISMFAPNVGRFGTAVGLAVATMNVPSVKHVTSRRYLAKT